MPLRRARTVELPSEQSKVRFKSRQKCASEDRNVIDSGTSSLLMRSSVARLLHLAVCLAAIGRDIGTGRTCQAGGMPERQRSQHG